MDNKILNKLDTYLIANENNYDLSGTIITSNHPVAVLSSTFASSSLPMMEQVVPVSSWAYRYIIPDIHAGSRHPSYIRAFASERDTYINTYYNGHPGTMHLNEGDFIETIFENSPYVMTSNKPIMVMQFMTSYTAMTYLPAISQFGNSFSIPPRVPNWSNYLVLIASEHDEAGITFEGQTIPSRQRTSKIMVDNVRYVVTTYSLLAGTERVFHSSSAGRFGGFVYGSYSTTVFYAYPFGLTLSETGITTVKSDTYTVVPAKSDSYVMFCLQSYQGLRIATLLMY